MRKDVKKIEKEIEEIKIKLSEEKNKGGFLENILSDIIESKYGKFYNLILILIGITSPAIPIIFLFRRDLTNESNIIPILIISIMINIIIFAWCIIFYRANKNSRIVLDSKIVELKVIKLEIQSNKIDSKINGLSNRINLVEQKKKSGLFKKNIKESILFELDKIYIRKKTKQIKSKLKKRKISINKNTKVIDKIKRDLGNKDDSEEFRYVIAINSMIGAVVIITKVLSYLGVGFINFKYILEFTMISYAIIAIRAALKDFLIWYAKIMIKVYNKKNNKAKYDNKLEYEQISIFDNIEL